MPSGLRCISWDTPELGTNPSSVQGISIGVKQAKPSWLVTLLTHLGVGDTSTWGHQHKICCSIQIFGMVSYSQLLSAWELQQELALGRKQGREQTVFLNRFATQTSGAGKVGNRQGIFWSCIKMSVKRPCGIMRLGDSKPKEEKTWVWILGFDVLFPGVTWYLVREYFENITRHAAGVFGSYSVLWQLKEKIKGKAVQDEILRGRNREAGRWDEEGSLPLSPTSFLQKFMEHVIISPNCWFLLTTLKNLRPILYWKLSFFFIQEDSVVMNCQEKKLVSHRGNLVEMITLHKNENYYIYCTWEQ